jgi:glutamate-1-semialdehyde 2,1-aminomutase
VSVILINNKDRNRDISPDQAMQQPESKDQDSLSNFSIPTKISKELFSEARSFFPSGSNRAPFYRTPYPLFIRSAQGSHIWDVDGNEFVDFVNNMGPLILGHRYPSVQRAVLDQVGLIWCGGPNELEIKLAEMVLKEYPASDKLLFCPTGTEAVMKLVRAARSSSGKKKVAMARGAFHGTSDVSVGETGVPEEVRNLTVRFKYNDEESFRAVLKESGEDLAAVLVEGLLGSAGSVAPTKSFLQIVREETAKLGILLIFDEVVTGFRVARGGISEVYGVKADATVLGKIIGGGFPVGALLGPDSVMDEFERVSTESPLVGESNISHGGTFNAFPVTMAAGVATLKELTPEVYDHLNGFGNDIRKLLTEICKENGIPNCVTGIGSIFNLHFTRENVTDHDSAEKSDERVGRIFDLLMLNRGINLAPFHSSFCSAPMNKEDFKGFEVAAREALEQVRTFEKQ